MNYEADDIRKANEARKLNILSGFSEFNGFEKAKDFNRDKKDTAEEDKADEDDSSKKTPKFDGQLDNNKQEGGNDEEEETDVHRHAKNTPDEHLEAYLQDNPDGEHAHIAKKELASRNGEDVGGEEGAGDIDYSNAEQVKQIIANHENKEAILALMLEDPTMTAATALKVYNASNVDNSATHAKIDAVENALNELKAHTGHGSDESGVVSTQYSVEELQAMSDEELQGLVEDLGFDFEDRDSAIEFILDSQEDDEEDPDDDEGGFDSEESKENDDDDDNGSNNYDEDDNDDENDWDDNDNEDSDDDDFPNKKKK